MNLHPIHIVIAEDDADDQFILKEVFANIDAQLKLTFVNNGKELVDFVKTGVNTSEKPDLILLDINMPVMDGLEALKRIKDDANSNEVPVYVLSTTRNWQHELSLQILGVNAYHTKPNDFKSFVNLVSQIISASREQIL